VAISGDAPSYYTARDLFCANAKATWPPDRVAALMGHGSVRTASQYYAGHQHAIGKASVEPDWDDVLAVRARAAMRFVEAQAKQATKT